MAPVKKNQEQPYREELKYASADHNPPGHPREKSRSQNQQKRVAPKEG
jgi:hypothetical protein